MARLAAPHAGCCTQLPPPRGDGGQAKAHGQTAATQDCWWNSLQIEISYYVLTFYFRSSSLKSLARSVEIPEKSCQL